MNLRPIVAAERERFASVGTPPEHTAGVLAYLEHLLAVGATRIEWCLLAVEGDRPLGRVALWALPGAGAPSDLVLLEAPWEEADLAHGTRLLEAALARARALGTRQVGHVLDSPPQAPQWQLAPERRAALLERAGFALARETLRFAWHAAAGAPPHESGRLVYRTLEEVGADAFVAAIARVTDGTLDRRLRSDQERLGAAGAARALFELLRALEYEPGWWQLAYTSSGALAGLSMPARAQGTAVIGYVGVVPEQRGRGYIDDLLARATAVLHAGGAATIVADTDTGNAPMAAAFRRMGYAQFATRREYFLDLAGGAAGP
jgi:ribosomal protein S18 acetylase RimI-like enzyme